MRDSEYRNQVRASLDKRHAMSAPDATSSSLIAAARRVAAAVRASDDDESSDVVTKLDAQIAQVEGLLDSLEQMRQLLIAERDELLKDDEEASGGEEPSGNNSRDIYARRNKSRRT